MKGAFEFGFILMFSLPIVVFGINFMQILMTYDQARLYQDYIVNQIEHQNRLDESVYELIDSAQNTCPTCSVTITPKDQRYDVKVSFPLEISLIGYRSNGFTHMLTQPIK